MEEEQLAPKDNKSRPHGSFRKKFANDTLTCQDKVKQKKIVHIFFLGGGVVYSFQPDVVHIS